MFVDLDYKLNEVNNIAYPMSKYSFLQNLNLENEVSRRLSNYLDQVVKGNDLVYLTPIAKDNNPEIILAEWTKIYEANKHLINDNLDEIEMSSKTKFGPRSIAKSWSERKDSLLEYFETSDCKISADSLTPDNKIKGCLRPLSTSNAVDLLKNSTNSGLPYFCKKKLVKDKVVRKFDELLARRDPCILFTRTQEGGKTRNVWGYPIADTLLEMTYYQPILGVQKLKKWRSALISPEAVDNRISDMIRNGIKSDKSFVSIDFSSFDTSVNSTLQRASFKYLSKYYQSNFHDKLDYIRDRFNTIGIVSPSGITEGPHGVPSGSTFTNEVDSIVQMLLAKYSINISEDSDNFQIQGDDGAYCISDDEVGTLFDGFKQGGLRVNTEKSKISKSYILYLQRLFDKYYLDKGIVGGIYPTYRALNRILFQERYSDFEEYEIKGKDYYSIRTLSILENVKYHPLFKEFVNFIKKYDKYSLKFTQEGLTKYNSMYSEADGTVGTIKNQYGSRTSGIRRFESYKILNS